MAQSKRSVILLVAFAVILAVAWQAVRAEISLQSLVPGDDEVSGWKVVAGADKLGTGEKGLYDVYDGGAGEYLDAGITQVFQRTYKHGGKYLKVSINLLGSWQQAKAFYLKRRSGIAGLDSYMKHCDIKQELSKATNAGSTIGYMWARNYFCSISVNGDAADQRNAVKDFGRKISAKVTAAYE